MPLTGTKSSDPDHNLNNHRTVISCLGSVGVHLNWGPAQVELHLLDCVSWNCPDVTFSMSLVQSVQSHLLGAHYFSLCKIN